MKKPFVFVCCQHTNHTRQHEDGRVLCKCMGCDVSWIEIPLVVT